jgi:arylsulfatase A-like enzyme
VTTDHGRDVVPTPDQWAEHGVCVKRYGMKEVCEGCRHVFAVAVGPGIKPRTVTTQYTHLDLAPTVAKIFGLEMPTSSGKPIPEIVGR